MGKVINFKDSSRVKLMSEERKSKFNLIRYILYFANNTKKDLYKTKLNKLLFYTQFIYYKEYNERLLIDNFISDFHGPTIINLNNYLSEFERTNLIRMKKTEFGNVIKPIVSLSESDYNEKELEVLEKVLIKFDPYTSAKISDYSHREKLWDKENIKGIINIERAKELNEF